MSEMDPGEHTVDEVKKYAEEHPDEVQDILDAEREGKNRTSLVTWLEGQPRAGESVDQPEQDQPEESEPDPLPDFRSP